MKKTAMFAMLIAVASITPTSNAGVIVDTSVGQYEVETILTSFRDSETLLKSQVWWENVPVAEEFATAVGLYFGTPNLGIYTPFFWQTDRDTTGPCAGIGEPYAGIFFDHRANRASPVCAASAPNGPFTFAVATPTNADVPEPSTVGLMLLGLTAMARRWRRRRVRA